MMKDLKDILGHARVPDPGEAYWESFAARVERKVEQPPLAAPRPDLRLLRLAPALASAAVLALVLSWLPTEKPAPPTMLSASPPVRESKRTAVLAVQEGPDSVLVVLGRAARDKADRARDAFAGGDTTVLLPLARSWEKIVRMGLVGSIEQALERDEDIEPFVVFLKNTVLSRSAEWERMVDETSDPDSLAVLEAAVDATDALYDVLDSRFDLNGKG
jgi:hypothetical protein